MLRLSPFDYGGGKAFLIRWIYDHFPKGWEKMHWVDLYGGSGVVTFSKPKQRKETLNDLNYFIWQFWKVLRDHSKEFLDKLNNTPISRKEFIECHQYINSVINGASDRKDIIEETRMFYVLIQQSINHSIDGRTWKRNCRKSFVWRYKIKQLNKIKDRIKDITLECRPAIELIQFHNRPYSFLFIDPPYYGHRSNIYGKYEMNNLNDHIELAESLKNHPGKVMLCGMEDGNHPYDTVLKEWIKVKIESTRNMAYRKYNEVMWLNYEPSIIAQPDLFTIQ